jgi:hypothetical protein
LIGVVVDDVSLELWDGTGWAPCQACPGRTLQHCCSHPQPGSIRSKHGVTVFEREPDKAAREAWWDEAVLDLLMWKLPQLWAHSVNHDPAIEEKIQIKM